MRTNIRSENKKKILLPIILFTIMFELNSLAQSSKETASDEPKRVGMHEMDPTGGKHPNEGIRGRFNKMKTEDSNKYIHNWVKLPDFQALRVESEELYSFTPKYGTTSVVTFIASWCMPCQQLIGYMLDLEKKYKKTNTEFIYVFTQDSLEDAQGFIKTYNMNGTNVLANSKMYETYHQPELPAVYVGDRYNWLIFRESRVKREGLKNLDEFLRLHTSF